MNSPAANTTGVNTRARLLLAAETLFITHGYEAMLLRDVTRLAGSNSAAVNYHFGGKERLVRELLTQRLERLNRERLLLLSRCELAAQPPDAATVFSVLFVPALRLSRPPSGNPSFMRLLGRVYSDPSPFVQRYLQEHYRPIFERFFEAFARALPHLARSELSMRLRFSLQCLSGLLAGEGMDKLMLTLSLGEDLGDTALLARLISIVLSTLTMPLDDPGQIRAVEHVMALSETARAPLAADLATSI